MPMTITPAAAEVIRDSLRRSELRRPVVCLVQSCNTPSEILAALQRGAAKDELEQISRAALANEPMYLYPGIYPSSRVLWILKTTIAGFPFASRFAHPSYARDAMKTGVLDVAERGLVLKDKHGRVVMPRAAGGAL